MSHLITTIADLESLYGEVNKGSLLKETDRIVPEYRALIEASPFLALATRGPEGLDCSPRGDGPGFVRVRDEKTLLLPDRRGNNRIDSLRNIVRDPSVALLFLIPGIGETLRVNGRAAISVEPVPAGELLRRRQGAEIGDRDHGGGGVLPMRPGDPALGAVESAKACGARLAAERRPDPRGPVGQRGGRRGLRQGAAGTAAYESLLNSGRMRLT